MITGPLNTRLARTRSTLFIILPVVLAAVAFYPIYQGALPEAHATNVHFSLVANTNGWNYTQSSGKNPSITVLETDAVSISFTADDNQQHQFYADIDRNSVMDCPAPSGDLCTGVFNSTNPAVRGWGPGIVPIGIYHYYDSLHQPTTNGTLIVQPGPYPATARLSLVASTNGWNNSQPSGPNPTITILFQQNVYINYSSLDPPGVQHQFYVDVDRNGVPDCFGRDACGPIYDSHTVAGSYWGGGAIPPGRYRYYDNYYRSLSNGTFIVLAPTADYYVSAGPSSLTIPQGGSRLSTIRISSMNNYTGTVTLTANPNGVQAILNPTSVSPPINGISTSTLNITAPPFLPPGNYVIGITASNGTTQRNTTVNVQVTMPDFTLSANTNTLYIVQGQSSTATITVTSQNGFSGMVSLKAQTSPTGPSASLRPSTVNIASGNSQTSTLTITTTSTTQTGTYTITIASNTTTTNGPLTHTTTLSLKVNSSASTNPSSPTLPTFFFEVLAAAIFASLAVLLARHRSNRKKNQKFSDQPGKAST